MVKYNKFVIGFRQRVRGVERGKSMSEWIVSIDPKIYDVINALRNFGTIDWIQSIDMKVGDSVYMFATATMRVS